MSHRGTGKINRFYLFNFFQEPNLNFGQYYYFKNLPALQNSEHERDCFQDLYYSNILFFCEYVHARNTLIHRHLI